MNKFKVGDTVRISERAGMDYENGFVPSMAEYRGKESKVVIADSCTLPYRLECGFRWHESWLEPIDTARINISFDDLMGLLK